jgi:hypothetical protein
MRLTLGAVLLSLLSISCFSCKKQSAGWQQATITGYDLRTCPCCGGLKISFESKASVSTTDFKLIDNHPELGISPASTFPIPVDVRWTPLEKCSGAFVQVAEMRRR